VPGELAGHSLNLPAFKHSHTYTSTPNKRYWLEDVAQAQALYGVWSEARPKHLDTEPQPFDTRSIMRATIRKKIEGGHAHHCVRYHDLKAELLPRLQVLSLYLPVGGLSLFCEARGTQSGRLENTKLSKDWSGAHNA